MRRRLMKHWKKPGRLFLVFDDAVAARIEYHQSLGLIPPFSGISHGSGI